MSFVSQCHTESTCQSKGSEAANLKFTVSVLVQLCRCFHGFLLLLLPSSSHGPALCPGATEDYLMGQPHLRALR